MENRFQNLKEDIRSHIVREEQEKEEYRRRIEKAREEKIAIVGGLVELFNDGDVQAFLNYPAGIANTCPTISLGRFLVYKGASTYESRFYEATISKRGLVVTHTGETRTYPFPAEFDKWFEAIRCGEYDRMGQTTDETVYRISLDDVMGKIEGLVK